MKRAMQSYMQEERYVCVAGDSSVCDGGIDASMRSDMVASDSMASNSSAPLLSQSGMDDNDLGSNRSTEGTATPMPSSLLDRCLQTLPSLGADMSAHWRDDACVGHVEQLLLQF